MTDELSKEIKRRKGLVPPKHIHCDLCGDIAIVDTKTLAGPWAYLCTYCNDVHGCGVASLTNKVNT